MTLQLYFVFIADLAKFGKTNQTVSINVLDFIIMQIIDYWASRVFTGHLPPGFLRRG